MKRRRRSGLGDSTIRHEKDLKLFLDLAHRFLEDAENPQSKHRCANAFEASHFASKATAENNHLPMSEVRPSEITLLHKKSREAILRHCGCVRR